MKVGFLNNQIDNRGTGNALFDYAHYNEEILGNESMIFTVTFDGQDMGMTKRLIDRFGEIQPWFKAALAQHKPDVMYHIKYGTVDHSYKVASIPYLVHAVFDAKRPHGDRFAAVSKWLGKRDSVPWVPHIVQPADTDIDMRERLNIPRDALVIGRHGGWDTFDVPFVWEAVENAILEWDNIYFLFMNTDVPDHLLDSYYEGRVIALSSTVDPYEKREFLNTCNAMIHARQRGETFGLAVGEFAVLGKPIITYGHSPEKSHYKNLQDYYPYYDHNTLMEAFGVFVKYPWLQVYGYADYTPEKVMAKFKKVFLDGIT